MMVSLETCLRVNTQEIAAKVLDGEAVMINISTGLYYSLDKVGGRIWELVERGHSLDQISSAVAAEYEAPLDRVRTDVERLAEELLKEALVTAAAGEAPSPVEPGSGDPNSPYEAPELKTYRDMSNLLALDPPMPGLQETPWEED